VESAFDSEKIMSESRLIVLGSVNTDLVVKVSELPRPGATVIGGTFYQSQGGKGANQAVAAARVGLSPVTFVAAVGEDGFGRESLSHFSRENMDLRYIVTKREAPSGVALIIVDQHAENMIAVASGANALLSPSDVEAIPEVVFRSASVFLTCLEIPVNTVLTGLAKAKKAGLRTILNPAPASKEIPPEMLQYVDVITPNETEASQMTGIEVIDRASAEQAAHILKRQGVKNVVVTMGSRGCLVIDDLDRTTAVPAFKVDAVDTTGAGDAFNGVLAAALSEGHPWEQALRWATAAAAISVTRPGAQSSLPFRKEVEMFLAAAAY
jgi:ribokinase